MDKNMGELNEDNVNNEMKERIISMVELHLKMDEDEKNEKGDCIVIIPIYTRNSDL